MSTDEASKDGTEWLRQTELDDAALALDQIYLALAVAYEEAGAEINDYVIDEYLPTKVFELAKRCGWVSLASYRMSNSLGPNARAAPGSIGWIDPDNSSIGNYCVSTAFRDSFYQILAPAIESLRAIFVASAGSKPRWVTPTPADLVKKFLDEERWTKKKLIETVADREPRSLVETVKKQLKVIVTEPHAPTYLKDSHKALCNVMREHSKYFRSLQPLDLVWRYQR